MTLQSHAARMSAKYASPYTHTSSGLVYTDRAVSVPDELKNILARVNHTVGSGVDFQASGWEHIIDELENAVDLAKAQLESVLDAPPDDPKELAALHSRFPQSFPRKPDDMGADDTEPVTERAPKTDRGDKGPKTERGDKGPKTDREPKTQRMDKGERFEHRRWMKADQPDRIAPKYQRSLKGKDATLVEKIDALSKVATKRPVPIKDWFSLHPNKFPAYEPRVLLNDLELLVRNAEITLGDAAQALDMDRCKNAVHAASEELANARRLIQGALNQPDDMSADDEPKAEHEPETKHEPKTEHERQRRWMDTMVKHRDQFQKEPPAKPYRGPLGR